MKTGQSLSSGFELDTVDIQILNLLQLDGKLSVRELARKIGLSTTPIHERLRRLESTGIIDHYAAVLNTNHLGQFIIFFVYITLKEHGSRQGGLFIERIRAFPEVGNFMSSAGSMI